MFWRLPSPLDADDEAWQVESWTWLLRFFGGVEDLREAPFVLPAPDFFTLPAGSGHDAALAPFLQRAGRKAEEAMPHLGSGPAANLRKAASHLAARPEVAADLCAVPAAPMEAAP